MTRWAAIILTALMTVSCVPPGGVKPTEIQNDVRGLREIQAEQTSQISDIRNELRTINGKLEELQYKVNQSVEPELRNLREALGSFNSRIPPPPNVPADELQQDQVHSSSLPADAATFFQGALERLRIGNYNGALENLDRAAELIAGTGREANLLFWRGVSYDGLGQFREALIAYNECGQKYPKHPRAPACFYRQAITLVKLKDFQVAKLLLKKIGVEFPKSKEAGLAREKLKDF